MISCKMFLALALAQAEVMPSDKVELVSKLQRDGKTTAFIGDGINDSPVRFVVTILTCVFR